MIELIETYRESIFNNPFMAFIPIYIASSLLIAPGMFIALLGGYLFGFEKGFLLIYLGSILASLIAFILGKYFSNYLLRQRFLIGAKSTFGSIIKKHSQKQLFWIIFFASPFSPFRVLSYLLGASSTSTKNFLLVITVSLIPHMMPYAYLGSVSASLFELTNQKLIGNGLHLILINIAIAIGALIVSIMLDKFLKFLRDYFLSP